jgi:F-type H+-transporting ATPase subunit delta
MKINKETSKLSKSLLRASLEGGRVSPERVRKVVEFVANSKPRNYLALLKNYHRLVRLEVEKSHAVVFTAYKFDKKSSAGLEKNLQEKFGPELSTEFRVDPSLISGVRIRVGSTVWENSVRSRLASLEAGLAGK